MKNCCPSFRNWSRSSRDIHMKASWLGVKLMVCGNLWGKDFSSKQCPVAITDARGKQRRINERLSFLRYGPGNYFRTHCDGRLDLPDGRKSRVTLQVYLNEDGLSGGATRIWDIERKNYMDIQP